MPTDYRLAEFDRTAPINMGGKIFNNDSSKHDFHMRKPSFPIEVNF
jgi:hypothetical protein